MGVNWGINGLVQQDNRSTLARDAPKGALRRKCTGFADDFRQILVAFGGLQIPPRPRAGLLKLAISPNDNRPSAANQRTGVCQHHHRPNRFVNARKRRAHP